MAVTAPSLYGQHPDDTTEGSSSEEDEEVGELIGGATMAAHEAYAGSSSSTHLLLHKRISQTYPDLSCEALLLLGEVSKPSANINSTNSSLLAPLHNQLESLRELIPAQPAQVAERSSASCLITDALDFIDQMNSDVRSLHAGIQASFNGSTARSCDHDEHLPSPSVDLKQGLVKVEYLKDSSLHIHVQCIATKGVLTNLLCALESLHLVVDKMDVLCNQILTLDVITSKVMHKTLDENFVRQVLLNMVARGVQ